MKINSLILLVVSAFFMFACDSATKFNNPLDEHNKPSDQTDTEAETDNDGDKTDTMSENDDENQNRDDSDSGDSKPDNGDSTDDSDSIDTVHDNDGNCTEGTFKCHSMFVSHICKNGDWQLYEECADGTFCNEETGKCGEETPCSFNPCDGKAHSTGKCIVVGAGYKCECEEGYYWEQAECVADPCAANPCSSVANSNGNCMASGSPNYSCGCKTHYTWNSSSKTCVADTQTVNCTGLPATGAVWNTVSSIMQTWNGSDWEPSNVATHNDEASTQECRYRCKEHYTWTNSTCKADQQVKNCTEIPANAEWNTVSTITQTWNGTSWAPSTNTTYNETASSSECRFKCAENYTYENSQCVGAKRTKPCTGLPKNAVWNTAESIQQTWDGYDWSPSNTGVYNTTASTDYCRYKCDEFCKWENSKCVSPCDSEPCVSVENSTGHCTVTGWDEYSCECEAGYFWNDSECKKILSVGNICTGQKKCYTNSGTMTCPVEGEDFFGQDPQYAELGTCTPQMFRVETISGDNVVVDINTNLMWQQTISSSTYDWSDAGSYCSGLTYAGYDDWRLPTPKELFTIVDNSRYNPAIDTTYFPNTPSSYFWSSSTNNNNAWYVYFDDGPVGYSLKTNNGYVRCVR